MIAYIHKYIRFLTILKGLIILAFFNSCATTSVQYGSSVSATKEDFSTEEKPVHTFYLLGDAGNADEDTSKELLNLLAQRLESSDSAATLLFLGDNIYPKGMPAEDSDKRALAEEKMDNQLLLSKKFKGKTVFIPGNHDWSSDRIKGLKRQEDYVNAFLEEKRSFLPRRGCGIDKLNISDSIVMIVLDSQWYLEDWDKSPTINDNCAIKTREAFFEELEGQLNKSQNKTVVLAVHHPLMSSGPHGGEFSLRKHLYPFQDNIPLPVIGSLINLLRATGGISPQDIQNKKYSTLINRIKTLIQNRNNVVVVSGHEHNIQYLEKDNIKQIISGSASKTAPARAINPRDFSYGGNGYAILKIFKGGNTKVSYYGSINGKETLLYEQNPIVVNPTKEEVKVYPDSFPDKVQASVYTEKMTKKSGVYRFLWGNHYRKYYSLPIEANTVVLDTLYGGLTPVRAGGGHQSKSLRLVNKDGKEYVMRALKKSAVRFLQSVAFKDQFIENDFKDTYTESFLLDFYTTTHPYLPFIVGDLADPLGINHTNPVLYYVPKQEALKAFNNNFGDELYMIEERPMSAHSDLESFGKPPKIINTDDVLANLRKDEKYQIDEETYIRVRLFDMLIGDWDRHSDQWRWGEYEEDGKVIYRAIARDRDQAFSKNDGKLLSIIMTAPPLRHIKPFKKYIGNIKWFNMEPYPMDLAFVTKAYEEDWVKQANFIRTHLTDEFIDKAFLNLPQEMQDETITEVKEILRARRADLEKYARDYYKILSKTVLITGTDKRDRFVIDRLPNGKTRVQVYRIKKSEEELIQDKTYYSKETKELWIYGLDREDIFEVKGKGNKRILIRLLGGQDEDTYLVENGKRIKIYDFKNKKNKLKVGNNARVFLSNNYEVNNYDYQKPKYNAVAGYPWGGYNPDDGVKLGALINYTINGFNRFPYSQRHSLRGGYYFATSGYELHYKGIFTHFIGKWNLGLDAWFTSANFSINFFGYGNQTKNFDKEMNKNYNRVKTERIRFSPSLQWLGEQGGSFTIKTGLENVKVQKTKGRFIAMPDVINSSVFNHLKFADVNLEYSYKNADNISNPTMGMAFSLLGGWTINLKDSKRRVPYLTSSFGFNYKLTSSGRIVLATQIKGQALFSDDYEFYQAATVGGDKSLRGFRNERFAGKQSFFQTSDLRFNIGKLKSGLGPIKYGLFGGYDYGRIWLKGDNSSKWHQSAGGGLWFNAVDMLTTKFSYFQSSDGGRFTFAFGFGF